MPSYAIRVTEKNRQAIASEDPDYDSSKFDEWLNEFGGGYFVRDPSSPFDCHYIADGTFEEIYVFMHNDPHALFRQIRFG